MNTINEIRAKRRAIIEDALSDPIFMPQPEEIELLDLEDDEEAIVGTPVLTRWMLISCVLDTGDDQEMIFTLSPSGATYIERLGLIEAARDKVRD